MLFSIIQQVNAGGDVHLQILYFLYNMQNKIHNVSILQNESIFIGSNMMKATINRILEEIPCSAYIVVTDENLVNLHLEPLLNGIKDEFLLRGVKSRLLHYVIPPGEVHKTRKTKEDIEDFLLENSITRDSCMIALGGGVIGDLVGISITKKDS
jgi:pentafunctional AROM polypeptide